MFDGIWPLTTKKVILLMVLFVLICLLASGCNDKNEDIYAHTVNSSTKIPKFTNIYHALLLNDEKASSQKLRKDKLLTVSVSKMPLREFLLYVNSRIDASIICDMDLDDKPVTIDVIDMDVAEILSAVARRCGADIIIHDNLYYIGNLQAEDRGFLVRKVRRLNAEDIEKVLSSLISDLGRVFASADGLIVVGDRVRVLQRINSMLDDVERQPANTWIVQMYLISVSDKRSRDLGFDTSIEAGISTDFSTTREKEKSSSNKWTNEDDVKTISNLDVSAAFASTTSKLVADNQFRAVLKAAKSSTDFRILAEPMMLVVDGGEAKISDGEKIPVPQKAISDSGTVTTIGYEYFDTGIIVSAGIREMTQSTASCTLSVDLTQINGYVESAPITSGQTFTTNTVLESGGTYLVGSMSKKATTKERSGSLFTTLKGNSRQDGTIMVWLRCYRIQGPYKSKNIEQVIDD